MDIRNSFVCGSTGQQYTSQNVLYISLRWESKSRPEAGLTYSPI